MLRRVSCILFRLARQAKLTLVLCVAASFLHGVPRNDWIHMLTVANLVIIGKMASCSCYLEIGGFSKWCLKLVWVWPFLSNHYCFGVACYLRNAVHCQCMPYSDRYNYILTTDVVNTNACVLNCILCTTATIMNKTIVFWSGTNLFWTEFCTASVVCLKFVINIEIVAFIVFAHWIKMVHLHYICPSLMLGFIINMWFHLRSILVTWTPILQKKYILTNAKWRFILNADWSICRPGFDFIIFFSVYRMSENWLFLLEKPLKPFIKISVD